MIVTEIEESGCFGKKQKEIDCFSEIYNNYKKYEAKINIPHCVANDFELNVDGKLVKLRGKHYKNGNINEEPVSFFKDCLLPNECDMNQLKYTITPNGIILSAPKNSDSPEKWPTLDEDCTSNCIDKGNKFEIQLNVQEFKPEDIKIKVRDNTIFIKATNIKDNGMKKIIKTYSLPEDCEITQLERTFMPNGYLILSIPKFMEIIDDDKLKQKDQNNHKVKCKFHMSSDNFQIKIDTHEFRAEDITVSLLRRCVKIEGKKCRETSNGKITETFEKTFILPLDYDIQLMDKQFLSDGTLVVTIPRTNDAGSNISSFKTLLPENTICDLQIMKHKVEIKLNVDGYKPNEISVKAIDKNIIAIEGKQHNNKGKVHKSFIKSYLLPGDCNTDALQKYFTCNSYLHVSIPRRRKHYSLDNLSSISDKKQSNIAFDKRNTTSIDNLTDKNLNSDMPIITKEKMEIRLNVKQYNSDDIFVKITKNFLVIECKTQNSKKGVLKSYLIPKGYDINRTQTFITSDDILFVVIPKEGLVDSRIYNLPTLKNGKALPNLNNSNGTKDFNVKMDLRGYQKDEIEIKVQGQKIFVLAAALKDGKIVKHFNKEIIIPLSYNISQLKHFLDENGFLIISAPFKAKPASKPPLPDKISNLNITRSTPENLDKINNKPKNFEKHINISDFRKEAIEIKVHGNQVTIFASAKNAGRIFNRFSKTIRIPLGFDASKLTHQISSGNILTISAPRKETSIPILHSNGVSVVTDQPQNNNFFVIQIDVQGYNKGDIDITVFKNSLIIKGRNEKDQFEKKYVIPEYFNAKLFRSYIINGILNIKIPKTTDLNSSIDSFVAKTPAEEDVIKIDKYDYFIKVDVRECIGEKIEVISYDNIIEVNATKKGLTGLDNNVRKTFEIPLEFNIIKMQYQIYNGYLIIKIPKKDSLNSDQITKKTINDNDITFSIHANENVMQIIINAPYYKPKDVTISTDKNLLTIKGSRLDKNVIKTFSKHYNLPENSIIDKISKEIDNGGKIIIYVPKKYQICDIFDEVNVNNKKQQEESWKNCYVPKESYGLSTEINNPFGNVKDVNKSLTLPLIRKKSSKKLVKLFDFKKSAIKNSVKDTFDLKIHVPHHKEDEIDVKLRGNTITIEGKRKSLRGASTGKHFFKTYTIPEDVDTTKITKQLIDQYLIITAPRV